MAGFGTLAWATIIILFLRKAMIIATMVFARFAPFAMAGLAYGKQVVGG